MATNFYFNNFGSSLEQQLIENLVVESIKIYGHDVFYLPKTLKEYDEVYGEDPSSYYNSSYMVEMYIKNVEGFEGEGEFLSKFNLEIKDRVTLVVARKAFNDEVGAIAEINRPLEGDLIYFPLNRKIFQIKFVEHEAMFYPLGSLQTYELTCELFTYSNERLSTGIPDVDIIQDNYSISMSTYALLTDEVTTTAPYFLADEDGFKLINESYNINVVDSTSDNIEIETEADAFIDFSAVDPFSEGNI